MKELIKGIIKLCLLPIAIILVIFDFIRAIGKNTMEINWWSEKIICW